jgi:transcriptional regulator with XRE-family HTH domain
MSKPFKNLLNEMSPERRERIRIKTEVLKNEMALGELRQALDLTQEELAKSLHMKQAAISKFEHQSDIYLSTLRRILFAMGADLKIIAHFPDGDVLVNQFTDIRRDSDSSRRLAAS